jgi:predicted flap endonuclease-1-like 5' DNA nuclease
MSDKISGKGYPIKKIEGIGPKYAEKLAEVNIKNTIQYLEAAATPAGRKELAKKTKIGEKLILEWANLSDLMRIKGVSEEYSDLLEEAGVDTVVELKKRKPDALHKKMAEVNEKKKLVRKLPSLKNVEKWIEQAKEMDRVLKY